VPALAGTLLPLSPASFNAVFKQQNLQPQVNSPQAGLVINASFQDTRYAK